MFTGKIFYIKNLIIFTFFLKLSTKLHYKIHTFLKAISVPLY